MKEMLKMLRSDSLAAIEAADSPEELEALRIKYL